MYFEESNLSDQFNTRPRVMTATDMDTFAISTGVVIPLFLDDGAQETGAIAKESIKEVKR